MPRSSVNPIRRNARSMGAFGSSILLIIPSLCLGRIFANGRLATPYPRTMSNTTRPNVWMSTSIFYSERYCHCIITGPDGLYTIVRLLPYSEGLFWESGNPWPHTGDPFGSWESCSIVESWRTSRSHLLSLSLGMRPRKRASTDYELLHNTLICNDLQEARPGPRNCSASPSGGVARFKIVLNATYDGAAWAQPLLGGRLSHP
jgi:hypothetical protein